MINAVLAAVNEAFRLARQHAWTVALVLAVLWVLKKRLRQLKVQYLDGHRIADSSTKSSSSKEHDRQEAVRQARLRQQELLSARAPVAAAERKEQAAAERRERAERARREQRENIEKKMGRGRRLGATDDDNNNSNSSSGNGGAGSGSGGSGYNPMQPWTGNAGGGYRPARRTVQRG